MKRRSIYHILILLSIFAASCSTQKNTWVTRTYHRITSKYNIFFNGNESYKSGLKKVEKDHKDDYGQLLPIFKFGSDNTAKSIAGDMDRTVKKTSKVIALHSIKVKPSIKKSELTEKEKKFYEKGEYNPWVGNSYLLMGKAQFYKHDFKMSLETFKYVLKYFPVEPSHYTALVWMARTNIQMKELNEAQKILEMLGNDAKFPKKLIGDYNLTYADYFIRKNNFQNAAASIEKAYKHVRGKDEKIRLTYILAQLYTRTGENEKATEYYNRVIRMNPPYEMIFNAMINQAGSVVGGQGVEQIRKQLNKLLRDSKNKEYQDQIYYALGNLSIKEKNTNEALDLYKKSARRSVSNPRQKAKSYKTIADIYYDKPDYVQAQAFYDSTMLVMDQNFPDADLVNQRAKKLTDLVINLRTVEFEDSVQKLAAMSEKDLLAYVDNQIEKVKQAEIEAKQKENEKMMAAQFDLNFSQDNYMTQVGQSSGAWYFYNQTVKTFGENEFRRKWGGRKLEDNWRRSNKKSVSTETSETASEETPVAGEQKKLITNNKTREFYLQYIPRTDSMMKASHLKIKDALFNAGVVYKEELNEPDLSLKEFRELNTRYPNNDHQLSAYYSMYSIYKDKKDAANSEIYKNLIVSQYPDSKYANLLSNPHYLEELEKAQSRVYHYYDTVYTDFKDGRFQDVITKTGSAVVEFKGSQLVSKFIYIRALALGSLGDTIGFRGELKNLIKQYPKGEETESAKTMVYYLDNWHPAMKIAEEQKQAEETFSYQPEQPHLIAFVMHKTGNMNQLVFNLINYNLDNYSKINLNVSGELLGKEYVIVKVKIFRNSAEAFNYLRSALAFTDLFKDVNPGDHFDFIITEPNLQKMMPMNSAENYGLYYKKFYQSK